jgi:hypothetical protein
MRRIHGLSPVAFALCAAVLVSRAARAQSVVVPAAAASSDGEAVSYWALSPYPSRQQVLIAESALPRIPVAFHAIEVRRDGGTLGGALEAASVRIRLSLSSNSGVAAAAPSPRFAANRGASPQLAFDGRVDLPAVGPVAGASVAPWSAPQAVRLPFSVPYLHPQGTLCIETETRLVTDPTSGQPFRPFWPVDAVQVPFGGSVRNLGQACFGDASPFPAETDPAGQVPGGTGTFSLRGEFESGIAMLAVGVDTQSFGGIPLPIDLAAVGAPGCVLRVAPLGLVAAPFAALPGDDDQRQALVRFDWPFDGGLSGQRVAVQWLGFGIADDGPGFGLSNALDIVLGPARPDLDASTVEAPDPGAERGEVQRGRGPVFRLVW